MKIRSGMMIVAMIAATTGTTAFAQSSGADIYKAKCQSCHGAEGTPNPGIAKMMGVKPVSDPSVKSMSEAQMIATPPTARARCRRSRASSPTPRSRTRWTTSAPSPSKSKGLKSKTKCKCKNKPARSSVSKPRSRRSASGGSCYHFDCKRMAGSAGRSTEPSTSTDGKRLIARTAGKNLKEFRHE